MADPDRPRKPSPSRGHVINETAAAPKKGTGALGGVKPTRRGAPKTQPVSSSKAKTELLPAKREIKVAQSTIDSMRTMGMQKAIAKANSGNASEEFVEGAKRMYGNRVKPVVSSSPTVSKTAAPKPAPKLGPVVAARKQTTGRTAPDRSPKPKSSQKEQVAPGKNTKKGKST